MKRLISILTRWKAMPRAGRRAFLVATVLLPVFRVAIPVMGIARINAYLDRRGLRRQKLSSVDPRAVAAGVNAAAHHSFFTASCLTRTLFLRWLLCRSGVITQLRIGVRLEHGALDAHAWLELDGIPINDDPDVVRAFAAFSAFGQPVQAEPIHSP